MLFIASVHSRNVTSVLSPRSVVFSPPEVVPVHGKLYSLLGVERSCPIASNFTGHVNGPSSNRALQAEYHSRIILYHSIRCEKEPKG